MSFKLSFVLAAVSLSFFSLHGKAAETTPRTYCVGERNCSEVQRLDELTGWCAKPRTSSIGEIGLPPPPVIPGPALRFDAVPPQLIAPVNPDFLATLERLLAGQENNLRHDLQNLAFGWEFVAIDETLDRSLPCAKVLLQGPSINILRDSVRVAFAPHTELSTVEAVAASLGYEVGERLSSEQHTPIRPIYRFDPIGVPPFDGIEAASQFRNFDSVIYAIPMFFDHGAASGFSAGN